tara:strand:- start:1037 stop:1807 length:771 start_codon:yes stop_codon:yes gene_type:complete
MDYFTVNCYEHPLNEKVRTMLRLEDLFGKMKFFSNKDHATEHHAAISALFEILNVTSRADIKSDLLKELERQRIALDSLRESPKVSEEILNQILIDIQNASKRMLSINGKVGDNLRENEWLMAIKQRFGIPGGACEFDLPSYHHWLHLDPKICKDNLNEWIEPLRPVQESLKIILHILRNNEKIFQFTSNDGMFQKMGQECAAHLLRIKIDEAIPCYPEISASKYGLTIHFFNAKLGNKTKIYEKQIDFELAFCTL